MGPQILQGLFIFYCFGAGIALSRLTRSLEWYYRLMWLFLFLFLHIHLAGLIENSLKVL